MPPAYSAPTTAPALVPDTTSTPIPLASSILITPMWAKPLAAPPPSARPTRTGGGSGSDAGVGSIATGGTGRTSWRAQAASSSRPAQARTRRKREGRGLIAQSISLPTLSEPEARRPCRSAPCARSRVTPGHTGWRRQRRGVRGHGPSRRVMRHRAQGALLQVWGEALAEEVTGVPPRPLVVVADAHGNGRAQAGQAGGVVVLDRLGRVVAGLVVAVAQEVGQRQQRVALAVGRFHPAVQVHGRDPGAHEGVLVAAHEGDFLREGVRR